MLTMVTDGCQSVAEVDVGMQRAELGAHQNLGKRLSSCGWHKSKP